jgi:uncharacterized membrane-anchored protein
MTIPHPVVSRVPIWRLWLPLCVQTLLILAVPTQAIYTRVTGKPIVLQTAPVDPYDLLRGYSVTLSYEISQVGALRQLPGWQTLPKFTSNAQDLAPNTTIYVVLEAPTLITQPPQPWKSVRVSSVRPTDLKPNQLALRGKASYSRVEYGLETYYIPEDQRVQINQDISEVQRRCPRQQSSPCKPAIVTEANANSDGIAFPTNLWVEDRNYRF